MKRKNGAEIYCKVCGIKFYVPAYRLETAKFCSINCQNHGQYAKYIFNCESCGKECVESPSRRNYKKKFCSLECRVLKKDDEKKRRKKQKATVVLSRGKNSNRTIRKYIFENRKKNCQICGYDEYDFCLDVHHKDGNCLNNELENLCVLCVICHRKLHKKIITLE